MNTTWGAPARPRSPGARGLDRLEAAVLRALTLVVLLSAPAAVLVGLEFHAERSSVIAHQIATRYPATAVLLADAPAAGTAVETPASWVTAGGLAREGTVLAGQRTPAGTRVPIWLDEHDDPVTPPEAPSNAVVAAVAITVLGWLGVVGLCGLCRLLLADSLAKVPRRREERPHSRHPSRH
ncbi:Rv1733c family protein [Amycolatopsis magusensis]|uniref:Rv1733c family protein n=1 Tax=Amycolatopsis magusensis TaxID=882444 RepID=UPI003FD7ECF2